eukprot:14249-Heterococcus_DN1.PRE.6
MFLLARCSCALYHAVSKVDGPRQKTPLAFLTFTFISCTVPQSSGRANKQHASPNYGIVEFAAVARSGQLWSLPPLTHCKLQHAIRQHHGRDVTFPARKSTRSIRLLFSANKPASVLLLLHSRAAEVEFFFASDTLSDGDAQKPYTGGVCTLQWLAAVYTVFS